MGNGVTDDQGRIELLNDSFDARFTTQNATVFPSAPAYEVESLSRFHVSEAAV